MSEIQARHGFAASEIDFIHNGIADSFFYEGESPEAIAAAKTDFLRWAYTSTPFRGLDLLADVADAVGRADDRLRLEVYSSMKVYDGGEQPYEALYERLRR